MVERPSLSEQLEHYERVKEDADLARQCYTEGVEDGKQAAEARIAALEGRVAELAGALRSIKNMKPSELAPDTMPGLVHGPQLLFDNCRRIARDALASSGAEAAAVLRAAVEFEPITRRTAMPAALDALLTSEECSKLVQLQTTVDAYLAKRSRTCRS